MGQGESDDYCSFSKAIEHLGDRWSLLIVADLIRSGPRGFNALAAGLPGRISRSVLSDRLRRLEDLGLVSRTGDDGRGGDGGGERSRGGRGGSGRYRLTAVGQRLAPTLLSLRDWAATWVPDDPAMVERDPDVVVAWLARRVDPARLPDRRTILEITMRHERRHRCWLVLERDQEPYGCLDDPLLDVSRYVYVEGSATAMLALARGRADWSDLVADGSLSAFGDPALVRRLPDWFRSADQTLPGEIAAPDSMPRRLRAL